MWKIYHGAFQQFLNQTAKSSLSIEAKIQTLQEHCLNQFQSMKWLLETCFEDKVLDEDQYFFLTFTVNDGPITLTEPNEIVVSLLKYADDIFQIEIDVFHFHHKPLQFHLLLDGDMCESEVIEMDSPTLNDEDDTFTDLSWIKPV